MQVLHKYLTPERIDVIVQRQIRLTQPSALNDPFEMEPVFRGWGLNSIAGELQTDDVAAEQFWNGVDDDLKRRIGFTSFEEWSTAGRVGAFELEALGDDGFVHELWTDMRSNLDKETGVISLTTNPCSLLMWAHYGAAHRGFVAGLDVGHEVFQSASRIHPTFGRLKQVRYQDSRPSITIAELDEHSWLFTKSKDWSYEQEVRLILPLAFAQDIVAADPFPIHLYTFPPQVLRYLVLGARMRPEVRGTIIDTIMCSREYNHVVIMQAEPMIDAFGVSLKLLTPDRWEAFQESLKVG